MDNRVVIRYTRDIPAGPSQPAHIAGERLTVRDAATAKALHPDAEIVSYADGQPFVRGADESLAAEREAEAAAKAKSEAKAKADTEKAKTAKSDADSMAKGA